MDNTVFPPHLHPVPHLCSILLLPEGKFQNIDLIALLSLTPFHCPTPTAHGVKSEIWSMLLEIPFSLLRLDFLLLSPGSQLAKAETSRLFPGLPLCFQNTADYLHVPWPLPRTPFFADLRPQHESLLSFLLFSFPGLYSDGGVSSGDLSRTPLRLEVKIF